MEKLNDEQRKLIEDNYKLVKFLWGKVFYEKIQDFDEYIGLAHIALCKAAKGWAPERGEFSTYFTWRLRSEISHWYRSNNYDKRRADTEGLSLNAPIKDLKSEDLTVECTLSTGLDIADETVEEIYWKDKINKLPDRTQKMVQLTYEGYKREEVAKMLNVSRSLVSMYLVDFKKAMGY